jgi:hypothetical protein
MDPGYEKKSPVIAPLSHVGKIAFIEYQFQHHHHLEEPQITSADSGGGSG